MDATRMIAAPVQPNGQSQDDTIEEERKWIDGLTKMPSAKLLVSHFSAFESIIRSGGMKGVEPPMDQVSTWRRLFCWQLKQTNTPFGIGCGGNMPKCIAMCNLSGQHAFYYCNSFSLARMVTLVPQESQARVLVSVSKVISKAIELNASVWVGFCLPFQVGLERAFWEIRTIRKTRDGRVKDGEMAFSCNDKDARSMASTDATEHWSEEMLSEVCKKLMSIVSPVCLDPPKQCEELKMTPQQMLAAINFLKEDRKKLQEQQKQTNDAMREMYSLSLEQLKHKVKEAEDHADVRCAAVLESATIAKDMERKKNKDLEEHTASLSKQLYTQQTLLDEVKSHMAGMALKHEEDCKCNTALQKTLEAQVASMGSRHAKHIAESSKLNREASKKHEAQLSSCKNQLAEANKKVTALSSASSAMSVCSKQAYEKVALLQKRNSVLRGLLSLGGLRFSHMASRVVTLEEMEQDTNGMTPNAAAKEVEAAEMQLSDAKGALREQEEIVSELNKRKRLLDARISELEEENKRIMCTAPPQPYYTSHAHRQRDSNVFTPNQNTAVFMHRPSHQQAFPQVPYQMDPTLEGMISQLHSALSCITSLARSSKTNAHAAEMTQGKLDALSGVGMHCYDSAQHTPYCYN
jgi:hypothetical protein